MIGLVPKKRQLPPPVTAKAVQGLSARARTYVQDSAVQCAVCRGSAVNRNPAERWEFFGEWFTLTTCVDCGSTSTFPNPSGEILSKIYQGGGFNYAWYRQHYPAKVLDCLIRLISWKSDGISLGKRVLDFGGGVGYFSRVARLFAHQAITYDPMLGTGAAPAGGSFDSVVSLHVLEHSNDLDATVEAMRGFLKPQGLLVLAVPNGGSVGFTQLGAHWTWAQPPLIHIHQFTERGLGALLTRHGFEIQSISYHERWDANRVADVRFARHFQNLDASWGSSRVKPLVALRNSALRYLALASGSVWRPRGRHSTELAELLVVARKRDGATS